METLEHSVFDVCSFRVWIFEHHLLCRTRSAEKPLGRVTADREVRRNTAATAPIFSAATWTDGRLCAVLSFCPLEEQVGRIRTLQADAQNKRLKTGVKTVAHSVAHFAAKLAQNTPKRCSTVCRMSMNCIRWEYYLSDFKTAGFNRSPTPPFLILTYSSS